MPIDEDLNYFFNHSCDPNFWGDAARRDIAAGEEITLTTRSTSPRTTTCSRPVAVGRRCVAAGLRETVGSCLSFTSGTVVIFRRFSSARSIR